MPLSSSITSDDEFADFYTFVINADQDVFKFSITIDIHINYFIQ